MRSGQIAISRLRSGDAGQEGDGSPEIEAAYVVTLHLKAVPYAELWRNGEVCLRGPLVAGSLSIVKLDEEPIYFMSAEFDCLQLLIPKIAIVELADRFGIGGMNALTSQLGTDDPVIRYIVEALASIMGSGFHEQQVLDQLVFSACCRLIGRFGATESVRSKARGLSQWQERTAKMMLSDVGMPPSADEIAKSCNVSLKTFRTKFRRTTGMTPKQWHTRFRIHAAQHLLVTTPLPIVDIAFESGFADQSHFTRTFSDLTGASPGAWRRMRASNAADAGVLRSLPVVGR